MERFLKKKTSESDTSESQCDTSESQRNTSESQVARKVRKLEDEYRRYREEWNLKYFFLFFLLKLNRFFTNFFNDKTFCVICQRTITTKAYNIERHSKVHKTILDKLTNSELRKKAYSEYLSTFRDMSKTLKFYSDIPRIVTLASYELAYLILK